MGDKQGIIQKAENDLVLSFLAVRRAIGLLGFFLPVVLILWGLAAPAGLFRSISAAYYSPMREIFVGTLIAQAVFLWSYEGYRPRGSEIVSDKATARVAAVSAALISTTVATMAALGTTRRGRFKGQTLIYVMINQPLMVPEIVTAVALLIFFASIKVATGYTGLAYLILAHSAFCVPFAYLPIRARLEGMDLALETAASDLYARPWQTF
ncbi:MAG: hypothetical protein ABGW82_04910, partial [Paracoccus sp. (in: a-proteobacteria)]